MLLTFPVLLEDPVKLAFALITNFELTETDHRYNELSKMCLLLAEKDKSKIHCKPVPQGSEKLLRRNGIIFACVLLTLNVNGPF